MKPSPTSPAAVRAFGRTPPPTPHRAACVPTEAQLGCLGSPPSGRWPARGSRGCLAQRRDRRRLAVGDPHRRVAPPIPHTVRLPNISLSVANTHAVTVQSRVAGFVTIGPTITLVSARIWL